MNDITTSLTHLDRYVDETVMQLERTLTLLSGEPITAQDTPDSTYGIQGRLDSLINSVNRMVILAQRVNELIGDAGRDEQPTAGVSMNYSEPPVYRTHV